MRHHLICALLLTACGGDAATLKSNARTPDILADGGSSDAPSAQGVDGAPDSGILMPEEDAAVLGSSDGGSVVEPDGSFVPVADSGSLISESDAGQPLEDDAGQISEDDAGQAVESDAGSPVPACASGAKRCSGLASQVCNAGSWETVETCEFMCGGAGVCSGVCAPNTRKCYRENSVAMCADNGAGWVVFGACPYTCLDDGYVRCGKICDPGAKQCSAEGDAQTCDAHGRWQTTSTCGFACVSGSCTGVCKPGATDCAGALLKTCDTSGQWVASSCPSLSNAVNACSAGKCGMTCNNGFSDCDSKVSNGCEINSANDSNNCGACGQECCGDGACSSGTCQAAVVPISNPTDFYDVNEDSIYWTTSRGDTNGDLRRASLSNPSTFETVASNQDFGPNSLSVTQNDVFWATNSGLYGWRSEDTSVTYSSDYASQPRTDGTHLLWVTALYGVGSRVCSKDVQGFTSAVCYPNPDWNTVGGNYMFVSDGAYIYSTQAGGGAIYKIEIQSGTSDESATTYTTNAWEVFAETHADGGSYVTLTTDGSNLYATYSNSASKTGVWSLPLDGGSAKQIYNESWAVYPSTDGAYVFFYTRDNNGAVKLRRTPVEGGPTVTLASLGSLPYGVSMSVRHAPRLNSECVFMNDTNYSSQTGFGTPTIFTVNKEP